MKSVKLPDEMVNLGMTIPCKWKGIKPNRAFLDIAYKVSPSLVCLELKRREHVKLYKGIDSKDKKVVDKAIDKLREFKEDQLK